MPLGTRGTFLSATTPPADVLFPRSPLVFNASSSRVSAPTGTSLAAVREAAQSARFWDSAHCALYRLHYTCCFTLYLFSSVFSLLFVQ